MPTDPLVIPCPACGLALVRTTELTDPEGMAKGVRLEVYQCPEGACRRKAAVFYEPAGGMNEDQKTWVEREVARTGAFFPQDHKFGRGPGRL